MDTLIDTLTQQIFDGTDSDFANCDDDACVGQGHSKWCWKDDEVKERIKKNLVKIFKEYNLISDDE